MTAAAPNPSVPLLPPVGIVTVNWNAAAETARLLESLRALDYPDFRTVVVDNGSTDRSPDVLEKDFPEATVLRLPDNAGFGAANNAALRRFLEDGVPFAWLLNNDARPEPGALRALVDALLAAPRAGAAGAVVLEDDGSGRVQAWGGGRLLPWIGGVALHRKPADPLEFVTGASCLLRASTLREIGLFDERFFLYWEDADLCLRLRRAGWQLAVAENARVLHQGSATTGRLPRLRAYHSARSYGLLLHKHFSRPAARSLTAACFQSAGKLLRGNLPAFLGRWQGWRAGQAAARLPDPSLRGIP